MLICDEQAEGFDLVLLVRDRGRLRGNQLCETGYGVTYCSNCRCLLQCHLVSDYSQFFLDAFHSLEYSVT